MRRQNLLFVILCCGVVLPTCRDDAASPAPFIEITFPEEGSLQTNSRLRVKGTASNVDQLDVDGVVAEVVGGEWEALVPLSQGEVTVTATGEGATDSVTFTVDSRPPELEVTSPERALYMSTDEGESVMVRGTVSDAGTGLEIIKVGEQIIHPTADGDWEWEIPLQPGLNEITVTARDVAGNETEDIRGVMYGEFIGAATTIRPAFNIWLDERATADVEAVVEGFVTGPNLMVMASAFENENVEITSITLDPVDLSVELQRGVANMELVATNVAVEGLFTLSGDEFDITVEIRKMVMSLGVTPVVTEGGGLDVTFTEPMLDLRPEDLSYDVAGLSDEDNEFLENLVIDIARSGFAYVLSDGLVTSLYDPDILKRKISVLGREIVFEVVLEEIDVFADGALVRTSVTMPVEKWADVRESPGALHRAPGTGTGNEPTGDIAFSTTENAVDRILHGVWHSGLLHHELAGSDFSGIELPFELNAGALGALIDSQITAVAGADTPAGLRIRPMFPPIAEFDVAERRLLIRVGEFMVDLLLVPPGQEPIILATISSFLDLSVTLEIVEEVNVRLSFDTELRADVAAEPEIDLDDEKVEELLEDLIALLPTLFAQNLDLTGEEDINWVILREPHVVVHGANEDHATINLEMEPNPQELEPVAPPDDM